MLRKTGAVKVVARPAYQAVSNRRCAEGDENAGFDHDAEDKRVVRDFLRKPVSNTAIIHAFAKCAKARNTSMSLPSPTCCLAFGKK
jgi:hypothetical protein